MQSILSKPAAVKSKSRYRPTTTRNRKVQVLARLADRTAGVLQITQDGKAERYFFAELPGDFGRGFHLEKVDESTGTVSQSYHANVDTAGHSSCECKGFLRWNHCRHLESLTALIAAGKL